MEKSSIKSRLDNDLKTALKSKDTRRISVLRMLLSEIHNLEIDKRRDATDEDVVKVLSGSAKRHRDSIAQFEQGDRSDLVIQEKTELEIVSGYLPAQLSEVELDRFIEEAVAESGAAAAADFGRVMKILMPRIQGRADGATVSEKLKTKLNS